MEGLDLIEMVIAGHKDFLTGQNTEMFQRPMNPILTIAASRMLGYFLDRAGAISHGNRQANSRQHFQVIVWISEGHDLMDIKAILLTD